MAGIARAFHAGLIATLATSTLMVLKMAFGLMLQFDIVATLADKMGSSQAAAWNF
jgi:hypothetical protein